MASPAQLEANRKNALKSTGPRTEAGKAASRANALKHGLAGEGVASITVEADERREDWGQDYRIDDKESAYALDRLVAASIRIERCEEAIDGIFASDPERARLTWDADRRAECARRFAGLAKSPMAVVARLKGSLHGVDLLLTTWDRLGETVADGGEWTDAEESLALDLLGVPAACREGRTAIDPPPGADRAAFRREVVASEMRRLEATIEELGELDALDRKLAMAGLATLTSDRARSVLRYEREAWRRYREARKALAPLKIPAEDRVAPRPVSAPVPAARVEATPVATSPRPRVETKPIPPRAPVPRVADPDLDDFMDSLMPMNFTAAKPRRLV